MKNGKLNFPKHKYGIKLFLYITCKDSKFISSVLAYLIIIIIIYIIVLLSLLLLLSRRRTTPNIQETDLELEVSVPSR